MGLELAARDPRAAALLDHAGACGGFNPKTVLRRGGDRLSDTRILQPLLTAVTLGLAEALARVGLRPTIALGHSLGELAAWSALGGLSSEQAIAIAAARGRLLAACVATHDGAMLALPRMDADELAAVVERGRRHARVDVALHNGPGRWVLSGDRSALVRVVERVGGELLASGGAWHSRCMLPAAPDFRALLEAEADLRAPAGLILNDDGRALGARGLDALIDALVGQVSGTVRFAEGVASLLALEPRELVIVGPGKVVRALLRRCVAEASVDASQLPIRTVEGPADIDKLAERGVVEACP